MFNSYDQQVQQAILELDGWDLKQCAKISKHFEHMGLSKKLSGNALKALSEKGIIEILYQQA